jgi:2-C-methyl-D-erythritol 4-phosphate cytidylyltransferase
VSPRTAAVILAAGAGRRVGAEVNKVLLPLDGISVLAHSVRTAMRVEGVHRIVVVVRPGDREAVSDAVAPHLGTHDAWLVDGGDQRHESEWCALQALRADIEAGELDVVAVHDAARPLADADLWRRVIDTAHAHGGAIPVLAQPPLTGRETTVHTGPLVAVQTPQAFRARALLDAYTDAERDGFRGTDTAACLEVYADIAVTGVPGSPANIKVTFAEDLALAGQLLSSAQR